MNNIEIFAFKLFFKLSQTTKNLSSCFASTTYNAVTGIFRKYHIESLGDIDKALDKMLRLAKYPTWLQKIAVRRIIRKYFSENPNLVKTLEKLFFSEAKKLSREQLSVMLKEIITVPEIDDDDEENGDSDEMCPSS
jgi:histone H3/H4